MKTTDILLDLQFSLPNVRKESSKENITFPNHISIKGLKFSLIAKFRQEQGSHDSWNNYFVELEYFWIFDADNLPAENIESELIRDWIAETFLFKNVDQFEDAKYQDFEDQMERSPLVELGIEQ